MLISKDFEPRIIIVNSGTHNVREMPGVTARQDAAVRAASAVGFLVNVHCG
jgi:hypothetical protein